MLLWKCRARERSCGYDGSQGVFLYAGSDLRKVRGSKARPRPALRRCNSDSSVAGPSPPYRIQQISGLERYNFSSLAPDARRSRFGYSPRPDDGHLSVLPLSPPDRTTLFPSGSRHIPPTPSTAHSIYLLGDGSSAAPPCGLQLDAASFLAAPPRSDSACDCAPVHHWNQ